MPLVVFAGAEYGNGSSRDWAAKGTKPSGVRAVIAESFERIHRSNLVGMGVLPLTFEPGTSWKSLNLKGERASDDPWSRRGIEAAPDDGSRDQICRWEGEEDSLLCASRPEDELDYFKQRRLLSYVLRQLAAALKHSRHGRPCAGHFFVVRESARALCPSLRGAKRRSNPEPAAEIASLRSQ